MKAPSMRSRIRNGTLMMLAVALGLGALALPNVYRLGRSIREILARNYASIEAAQQMREALFGLQLAECNGTLATALSRNRDLFRRSVDAEKGAINEVGEAEIAAEIETQGRKLFSELAQPDLHSHPDQKLAQLRDLLEQLAAINRSAMFRADRQATTMSDALTSEFAVGLVLLLLFGGALSWTLAWRISRPLSELAERLRTFSFDGRFQRLRSQPVAELQSVASEFNKMAERLEQFEKLNVDRLIEEKNKTEAILENIEDGIVLIDSSGIVTHINAVAAMILGVASTDALGRLFNELKSEHPHYLRVRSALQNAGQSLESQGVEVELHVQGRDHVYVLKPVRLKRDDVGSFGTILILQDITYLRDKDRARANLVATLSHELKTPLTSLAFAAELLETGRNSLDPGQRELVSTIGEDIAEMRHLADDLLNLARGEAAVITVRTVQLDLGHLVRSVVKGFAMQAGQRGVTLATHIGDSVPELAADPIKLSWVISNLITNAMRYTPDGGTISVAAEGDGCLVRLKVSDTGPGVTPEIRDHLFERFTQWNVGGFPPGSAGLGLAIVKDIVEAHGGRIFVDNNPGGGTCFTVELPAGSADLWPSS
jgi:two-component system, NtrC family, sensor histidine kinase KinB